MSGRGKEEEGGRERKGVGGGRGRKGEKGERKGWEKGLWHETVLKNVFCTSDE